MTVHDMPRNRRGQETRAALLGAAAELIAEVGWGAVSTRAVAERAGVRSGLVHYHFGSVPQLLTAAATATLTEMSTALAAELAGCARLEDGVRILSDGVVGLDAGHPMHLLVVETYLAAYREPAVAEALREVVRAMREDLGRWLAERGVPAGRTEEVAAFVVAALDGFALHRVLDAGMPTPPLEELVSRWVTPDGAGPDHEGGR